MWYSNLMVKRDAIKAEVEIEIAKAMPGNGRPGPRFAGTLEVGEVLVVQSKPFSSGGLNLVKVRRKTTGETFDAIYAFVTNYCKLVVTDPGSG